MFCSYLRVPFGSPGGADVRRGTAGRSPVPRAATGVGGAKGYACLKIQMQAGPAIVMRGRSGCSLFEADRTAGAGARDLAVVQAIEETNRPVRLDAIGEAAGRSRVEAVEGVVSVLSEQRDRSRAVDLVELVVAQAVLVGDFLEYIGI